MPLRVCGHTSLPDTAAASLPERRARMPAFEVPWPTANNSLGARLGCNVMFAVPCAAFAAAFGLCHITLTAAFHYHESGSARHHHERQQHAYQYVALAFHRFLGMLCNSVKLAVSLRQTLRQR